MVETLSGTFNAILGGNVNNVMLHVNAATLRRLTSLIGVLYNVVLENHSVQNSPRGRGSIASPRPITEMKETYFEIYIYHESCSLVLPLKIISICLSVSKYLSLYGKLFIFT